MESFLKPMLATLGKGDAPCTSHADWLVESKLDGWRYVAYKDDDGDLHCYGGRNGAEYTGQVPYLERELADLLPDGTALDGELIGEDWGEVQSVMTNGSPVQSEPLRYVAFDLTRLSLRDVRPFAYEKRTEALTVLEWDAYPNLEMIEAHDATPSIHEALVDRGFEGSVWKKRGSAYVPTRSTSWVKFKHEASDEAVVTGFKPGQGEFAGMIGAIEFTMPNGVASRASGMDLAVRQDMTDNPAKWIGSMIEVKHNGIMASGKPRHPRFMRRRDDRIDPVKAAAGVPASRTQRRRTTSVPTTKAAIGDFRGASKRNYGAMGAEKLLRSIEELGTARGEAYHRCIDSGGDPHADYAKARAIAERKGLL